MYNVIVQCTLYIHVIISYQKLNRDSEKIDSYKKRKDLSHLRSFLFGISVQSICKLQVYYMSTKTKFDVIFCNHSN